MKKKILFICTHNSCRSQMAEGLANRLLSDKVTASSAGTKKSKVDPYAIAVMKELGIDISANKSKTFEELKQKDFDLVVTVCDHAKENCPIFFGGEKIINNSFQDPPKIVNEKKITSEEGILDVYRRVRDDIKKFILKELL
ncbi:MAG: hypothetical protein C0601_00750 [Candidatus Muiribacterium halophilum]|uniref:Phosphotyrosine protein phosphatase I domain-containing protein n=1 Tax=Muiribacterium halophilum TaxID=2053465 RepID=A0A2N5ZMD1_MUIH1|nr:MAG: hypothetical protein C0601_00750 [Candidatus Muirbacterium halophilum]